MKKRIAITLYFPAEAKIQRKASKIGLTSGSYREKKKRRRASIRG